MSCFWFQDWSKQNPNCCFLTLIYCILICHSDGHKLSGWSQYLDRQTRCKLLQSTFIFILAVEISCKEKWSHDTKEFEWWIVYKYFKIMNSVHPSFWGFCSKHLEGWPSGGLFLWYDDVRHVTTTIAVKSLTLWFRGLTRGFSKISPQP